jgi:hypothetical protein
MIHELDNFYHSLQISFDINTINQLRQHVPLFRKYTLKILNNNSNDDNLESIFSKIRSRFDNYREINKDFNRIIQGKESVPTIFTYEKKVNDVKLDEEKYIEICKDIYFKIKSIKETENNLDKTYKYLKKFKRSSVIIILFFILCVILPLYLIEIAPASNFIICISNHITKLLFLLIASIFFCLFTIFSISDSNIKKDIDLIKKNIEAKINSIKNDKYYINFINNSRL